MQTKRFSFSLLKEIKTRTFIYVRQEKHKNPLFLLLALADKTRQSSFACAEKPCLCKTFQHLEIFWPESQLTQNKESRRNTQKCSKHKQY